MATTTNYGWTTPDDTGLVKDGASAIRSLGSSVDTTVKALNPETTLGDIAYRSATANTNTRLAIGTTGQVLSVVGGVPAWASPAAAGGFTKIHTESFSAVSALNVNSKFSSTYKSYRLIFEATLSNSNVDVIFRLRASGTNATTNYVDYGILNNGSSLSNESYTDRFSFVRAASTGKSFGWAEICNPFAAEPTGWKASGVGSHGYSNEANSRNTNSTSYDGFSLVIGSGTMTGSIALYGYEA